MEKYIYDENNSLWYELVGDYHLPCLLPPENRKEIGIWGQRHFEYIKQNKKSFYSTLLMTDKLNDYLADIDQQANEMYNTLVKQLTEKEGITEKLKEENQIEWICKTNNVAESVREIVFDTLIYM